MKRAEWALTAVVLGAKTIERRFSYRFGRWLGENAARTHEIFLVITRRLGWLRVAPDLLQVVRATTPKAAPEYPSVFPTSRQVSRRATALLEGQCLLDDDTIISLASLSWLQDPFGNTSSLARLLFHSLDWVRELLDAHELTKAPAYLVVARTLTERWISECLYRERSENIWSDHGTAIRALILCRLWTKCHGQEPSDSSFLAEVFAAIVRHAEKLTHESFYRSDHDHGVTQAYALFSIGLIFEKHPRGKIWARLGRARLESQMMENVSCDGMHREHSLYYHLYIFQHFYYAYRLAEAYGVDISQAFVDRLKLMLLVAAYGLKPNTTVPALGDTSNNSPIVVTQEELEEWPVGAVKNYLYSSTQGNQGIIPEATSVLCHSGGWAFLRSGWGFAEPFCHERFFAFRSATFETAHIHYDVFSFELYGYGADLIVDSGGPFSYGHPTRGFFLSTGAHNTVTVDGQDQAIGQAEILHWHTSSEYDLLDAQHRLYPGVIHRRVVVFVKPDYFLIVDRLEAQTLHQYSQLFHLSPILEVQQEELSIATVNPMGGPTVRILPLWQRDLGLQLWRGETTPRQGWVCVGERQMIPNSVAEYRQTGTTVTFATLLVPEAPGASTPVTGTCEGIPFIEEALFLISIDGRCQKIVLLPSGQVILEEGQLNVF